MKYGFTGEIKDVNGIILKRIIALKDFDNVKKDDLGGWIEKESNLSHSGNAWVYDHALVYGEAKVSGDSLVYGYAKVSGDSLVYDHAMVYDHAWVYDALVYGYAKVSGDSLVYGRARIYDHAMVYGNSRIYGEAKGYDALVFGKKWVYCNILVGGHSIVKGDAIVTKKVINITGLKYNVTITDDYMCIGCENHPIDYWLKLTKKDIIKMYGKDSLIFYKTWNKQLRKLIKNR